MNVRVLHFAQFRARAGCAEEVIEVGEGARAADVLRLLVERHGEVLPAAALRVAVNGEFADWACRLAEGDEVVLLPPVAGG